MPTPSKPVKAFKHKDAKRAHIPSGEEAGYEAESAKVKEAGAVELPLNPVITRGQDPELFWMHKYGSDERLTTQLDELQAKLKAGDTAGARTALENLREPPVCGEEGPEDRRPRHQSVWGRNNEGAGSEITAFLPSVAHAVPPHRLPRGSPLHAVSPC